MPTKPQTLIPAKLGKKITVIPKTSAKVISALVPGHMTGVRPAPSTASQSGRKPLK